MTRIATMAVLALGLAVPAAHAQTTRQVPARQPVPNQVRTPRQDPNQIQNQNRGQTATGTVNDWLFAEAAALGGMAELQLSEVGIQRSTCDELKNFSKEMIQAHTKVNQELTTLAAQKRVTLPRTVDARAQFCAQSLSSVPGERFDHCYAKAQLHAHMEALAAFEAEAERGQDPDVKAFAARVVPQIKEHLEKIKPIVEKEEKEKGQHGERRASTESREK